MLRKKIIPIVLSLAALGVIALASISSSFVLGEGETSSEVSYVGEPAITETLVKGDYQLNFASSNLSFTLTDMATGEILHSGRRANDDGLNSATWQGLLADGLAVGYRNSGRTTLKPYSTLGATSKIVASSDALKISITFSKISISLEMDLTLGEGGAVTVSFPASALAEPAKDEDLTKNRYQLAYLLPYLGLGDSFELQEKGSFLFVPDGGGAIADLSEATIATSEYDHRIYGEDIGIQGNNGVLRIAAANPEKTIRLPVYGLSYADKPGVEGIVESGAPYADIYASVDGLSTYYNFAAARFNYREEYYRYVDRAGSGVTDFMDDPYVYDASVTYHFLPSKASLGAMAGLYRNYLLTKGLCKNSYEEGASLRLEWLMAETKATMFGDTELAMSHPADISAALSELASADVSAPKLAFLGYQAGGWSSSSYSSFKFASAAGYGDYADLASKAHDISFAFDYGLIRSSGRGYGDGDLAMTISNQGDYTFDPLTYPSTASTKDRVMLTSNKAHSKLAADVSSLESLPKVSLALSDFTSAVFSSHYNEVASREEACENQASLIAEAKMSCDLGMPNQYLLPQASSIIDLDLDSSNYYICPVTVPFYEMALSGLYDFYSKPLNLNYESDLKLRLIESDVNPSFLLTNEDSINLYQTSSSYLFSSQFSSWESKVAEVASFVRGALDNVRGSAMSDFEILSDKVTLQKYANGKTLLVNHGSSAYAYETASVPAGGYSVL
jgi:hypothetical protein